MAEILGMATVLGAVAVTVTAVALVVLALAGGAAGRRPGRGRRTQALADVHELEAVHPSDRQLHRRLNLAA